MNFKKSLLMGGTLCIAGIMLLSGCSRPGHCDKDFPEKIFKRVDKKIAKLDLNSEQQSVYDEIRSDLKADLTRFQEERLKAGKIIAKEINSDNPDMAKIAGIIKEGHGKHPEKFNSYIDRIVEFYNILDDEQKKIVLEKMRDHAEHFECD
ncbi:MAG: Spy/CpxP family protein refolding chaperone [Spirochaetes bacterium]|nr:Spy/CpxP family protein refolding chaperone [Spirochaetota bacterium]